mmetsp:Transcript_3420/g.10050  ORF Transcript_3420/g.10050 Transcript_3420/m.10050 type:complete len:225 (+) Transcript_3420:174-848(+)
MGGSSTSEVVVATTSRVWESSASLNVTLDASERTKIREPSMATKVEMSHLRSASIRTTRSETVSSNPTETMTGRHSEARLPSGSAHVTGGRGTAAPHIGVPRLTNEARRLRRGGLWRRALSIFTASRVARPEATDVAVAMAGITRPEICMARKRSTVGIPKLPARTFAAPATHSAESASSLSKEIDTMKAAMLARSMAPHRRSSRATAPSSTAHADATSTLLSL